MLYRKNKQFLSPIEAAFVRWNWMRAVLHNGWWLVTSIYLVVDADLSPSQLVLIGVTQGIVALAFEVPAGVLADTISRKLSLIVSHILMGTAMIATGLVTDFGLILVTQMLWGISWTFASGADVAWVTDELDEPQLISGVLVRSGRAKLTGAAIGLMSIGGLAALTTRSTAMITAGSAMLVLGFYVMFRFAELRFIPAATKRWAASWAILIRGFTLVRQSRAILVIFAATLLVNGAAEAGRLYQKRLVDIGLPSNPVIWFTVLAVLALLVGAAVLRIVEKHIEGVRTTQRSYIFASAIGAIGLIALAIAPEEISASAAILLVAGIATPLTNTISAIWVNRQASSEVRATVHSFLAQAEYLGEIICGFAIAMVARYAGLSPALIAGGILFVLTAFLICRYGTSQPVPKN